jgi:hypothetical protein
MRKSIHFGCILLTASIVYPAVLPALADPRDYAVEVSVTVQESPPQINFSWIADPTAEEYRVLKKAVGDTAWTGPVDVLDGGATSWSDTDIAVGEAYEYSFRKSRGLIRDTVAVASGTSLTFTIHDSWGDGICCDVGLGSYKVSGCDSVYASGGAFRSSKSTSFTVTAPGGPCDEVVVEITLDIFGEETTWELTEDATGDTLAAGGPYSSPRFGHILAGIRYPAPEVWGTVLLLVDEAVADSLEAELDRLRVDLICDGYRVRRHDVPDGTPVPAVKDAIAAECLSDPTITTLFIFGNVAVPYSGDVRGAHANHRGAWPADVYYGEFDGTWTDSVVNNTTASRPENHNVPGDGKFDQTYIPSDVDLEVGRVDLSNLPAFEGSEVEILRRYLDKNHAFRRGGIYVPRRGLIRDAVGVNYGTAYACTGWRNFTAMFGSPAVHEGLWLPTLEDSAYLCAYGCGGGTYSSCATVAATVDFATRTIYAVFTMMMGSYFADWDSQNNLMRAALGAQGYLLTCCSGGCPAWHFHHMAMGYPVGYSTRLTQNNHVLYMIGYRGRQIHIALMGDPTLRLHPVAPPGDLVLEGLPEGAIRLRWRSPEDPVMGYHVYRSASLGETFSRLNAALVEDTSYVDIAPADGFELYMVRAVRLETTASGTYLNVGSGVIDSIEVSAGVEPPQQGALLGNSPNPFLSSTHISYLLPNRSQVVLKVYDISGRLIRTIDEGPRDAGRHTLEWDGRDDEGRRVSSGVYFLSLSAGGSTLSAKAVRVE